MASERVMYWCYIFPFIALITLIVTASIGWDTNSDNIYNTSIVENNTSIVEDDESKYSTVEVDGMSATEEYFWCSVIFLSLFLLFWISFYISNKIENIKAIRNAERDRIEAIELQKQESKKRPFIIIKLICIYKSIINDITNIGNSIIYDTNKLTGQNMDSESKYKIYSRVREQIDPDNNLSKIIPKLVDLRVCCKERQRRDAFGGHDYDCSKWRKVDPDYNIKNLLEYKFVSLGFLQIPGIHIPPCTLEEVFNALTDKQRKMIIEKECIEDIEAIV